MSWRDQLRQLRPRDIGESLRWVLFNNAGIKLLSLTAAFGLWLFVNAGERDAELSFQVPVELRNVPPNVMLVSPRVDFVDVVARGPRTLLNRIRPDQMAIALDLRGVRPGPAVFRILSETLELPRGVAVMRLTPSEVTLEFATTLRRRVPVHVAVMGKAPHGLLITSTRVAPESVEVVGPADQVEQIKAVETEPIELSDAEPGIIERDLSLDPPREYISLSANLVHAELVLQEPERTRTNVNVPVVVRNSSYRTTVRPAAVQVTVRGPRSAMESLELNHGAVYIDATGQEPGTYDVTPAVDLPGDIELVKQEPSSIELRVLRQKQKSDGR